jgi:hypothetical protein
VRASKHVAVIIAFALLMGLNIERLIRLFFLKDRV